MDIEKIMKRKSERKDVVLSIRVTKAQSKWLAEKSYSPSGIFHEALLELQKADK